MNSAPKSRPDQVLRSILDYFGFSKARQGVGISFRASKAVNVWWSDTDQTLLPIGLAAVPEKRNYCPINNYHNQNSNKQILQYIKYIFLGIPAKPMGSSVYSILVHQTFTVFDTWNKIKNPALPLKTQSNPGLLWVFKGKSGSRDLILGVKGSKCLMKWYGSNATSNWSCYYAWKISYCEIIKTK